MNIIHCTPWGETSGQPVYLFRITNSRGAFVELTNYGATLVSAHVPDREGRFSNVVLGYHHLHGYLTDPNYMGSTIGRFANRIAGAAFTLDDQHYQLETNDNGNTNHGGDSGFHRKVFHHKTDANGIVFRYTSPDGEGGYPGNLEVAVHYQWTEENALQIRYQAVTDKPTIANFTNHAYFNLSGIKSSVAGHRLHICAQNILEANANHIPTGRIEPAGERAFHGEMIGQKLKEENGRRTGLNTYYILEKQDNNLYRACQLIDPASGRTLTVHTTYPGLILYTGDYIGGGPHHPFEGLCLECQYFPDSPNQSSFPSTVLRPGENYDHSIILHFT